MTRVLPLLLAAGTLSACFVTSDPCPGQEIWSETLDRCIELAEEDGGTLPDAGNELDGAPQDASVPPDAPPRVPPEAGPPAVESGPETGVPDDGSTPTDAMSGTDAATDASLDAAGETHADAASDAATDAAGDAGFADSCSETDQQTWTAFHVSDQLVESIKTCIATDPSCALGLCPLDECLRDTVGITTCASCVEAEVRCVAANCISDCGSASDDARCRACACRNGCVEEFGSCAGTPLEVCADCSATTCAEMSVLPPELIMVVVGGLLR